MPAPPRFITVEIADLDALLTDDRRLVEAFDALGVDCCLRRAR